MRGTTVLPFTLQVLGYNGETKFSGGSLANSLRPKRLHTACFTTVAPPMIVGGCSIAVVLWLPLEYYQWFRNGGEGGGRAQGASTPLKFQVCMRVQHAVIEKRKCRGSWSLSRIVL